MVKCDCTLATPQCAAGRYWFNRAGGVLKVIHGPGFASLTVDIREQIHRLHTQRSQQYIDHVKRQGK